MKKIISLFALLMIGVLVWFPLKASLLRAEDNEGNNGQEIKNNDNHDQENNDQENEDDNEDGQTNGEHDIYSLIVEDSQKIPVVNLPQIDEKLILTYADVVTLIKSYENAVSQIKANAGVDTTNSALSATEKALLDGLVNKHHNQFTRFNNRTNEVNAQLKQLEDLLTPLGAQSISPLYGIKGILVDELNNFKDIISGLSEFDNLNLKTLQKETD